MFPGRHTLTGATIVRALTSSQAFLIFFVLFFPLAMEYLYSDFVRESELFARMGWYLLLLATAIVIRHRLVPGVLLLPFLLSGCMDTFYAVAFGGVFTSASIEAVVLTDRHEAGEFLKSYVSVENMLLLGAYVTSSAVLFRRAGVAQAFGRREKVIVASGLLMLMIAIYRIGMLGKYYDTIPGFIGVLPTYMTAYTRIDQEISQRRDLVSQFHGPFSLIDHDRAQIYLVIIGESLNRNHLAVYGYHRDTSPALARINDLLVFRDVISSHAQTQPSLRYALTEAATTNTLHVSHALSVVDVANKAGFHTWWISNQQPLRSTISAIAHMANETQFISNDYHGVQVRRFDDLMLPYVERALAHEAKRKMIFVHMMGSHLQYENRFPQTEVYFTGNNVRTYDGEPSWRQTRQINAYDNSVRFTEGVVANMIRRVQQQSGDTIAAALFFSDHGEEVFDSKNFLGHAPDNVTPPMLEIPFLVWVSDAYRARRSEQVAAMAAHLDRPYMLDGLFHCVADLAGIRHERRLERNKSLASRSFRPWSRQVYGRDYDVIRLTENRLRNSVPGKEQGL